VPGTATADIRADAVASLLSTHPVIPTASLQAAIGATETTPWAARESTDKSDAAGLLSDKLPEGGGIAQPAFMATVSFDSKVINLDVQQPAPEAAIADQVSYWISQGIQTAELTFDGADAQPVQVSISLSGNEAHVEFRTDQLETRDLLTGAAAHLKDLLQSEGMVLSGLSVGASGAGGSSARERRTPPDGLTPAGPSRTEEGAVRPSATARVAQGVVDLFV
jgi:flagellar hook-length control protein FliK